MPVTWLAEMVDDAIVDVSAGGVVNTAAFGACCVSGNGHTGKRERTGVSNGSAGIVCGVAADNRHAAKR